MTLTEPVTKNIIKRLLNGEDYRIEVVALINADFLQFAIDFFKEIAQAKLENQEITTDWYKSTFLDLKWDSSRLAIHSGLNMKTVKNMFGSEARQIVIDASYEHYDTLYQAINDLVNTENEIDLSLTIKFNKVSVELNISESLIVINTLAVKRAALRGGAWATAGKKVEKPLMQTLCKLYGITDENYALRLKGKDTLIDGEVEREVDFYLIEGNNQHRCEVKLMGGGNPESADVVIARKSKVLIADTLLNNKKAELDFHNIFWVELKSENKFQKFAEVLDNLKIPHNNLLDPTDENLEIIFNEIF